MGPSLHVRSKLVPSVLAATNNPSHFASTGISKCRVKCTTPHLPAQSLFRRLDEVVSKSTHSRVLHDFAKPQQQALVSASTECSRRNPAVTQGASNSHAEKDLTIPGEVMMKFGLKYPPMDLSLINGPTSFKTSSRRAHLFQRKLPCAAVDVAQSQAVVRQARPKSFGVTVMWHVLLVSSQPEHISQYAHAPVSSNIHCPCT